jgi:hypothetical protein
MAARSEKHRQGPTKKARDNRLSLRLKDCG